MDRYNSTLSAETVTRYLERLGLFAAAVELSPAGLRRLQRAHLLSVPFENLDIHLGVPIVLEPQALVAKILAGRGGFCYELNGAFAELLAALGFVVTRLEARVCDGGVPGMRFDHLCLRVDLDEPWLVDVGFGASFEHPLRLATPEPQDDPQGTYQIVPAEEDGWLDLRENGKPQYRFSLTPRRLDEFADGCHYHQTSPQSHFTSGPVCTRLTAGGRVTLRGTRLIETHAGERRESDIAPQDLLDVYASRFGVHLSRPPGPRRA